MKARAKRKNAHATLGGGYRLSPATELFGEVQPLYNFTAKDIGLFLRAGANFAF